MTQSPSPLVELLSGKTPVAMYDELHARRCLSAGASHNPQLVIDFIQMFLRSSRQRPLMPANQIQRLVKALANSGFLNDEGIRLSKTTLPPDQE